MMTKYGNYQHQGLNYQNPNDTDNNYFNIDISNPLIEGTSASQVKYAEFQINSTQIILDNPNDYYLTVARFDIPASTIPIFIMQVINNQSDPNLTPYIFCLSYEGNDYPVNIIWQPMVYTAHPPTTAIPKQDTTNVYYNCYSYQHMINLMNIALATSFQQLKTDFPAAPPTKPPILIYNPDNGILSLLVQNSYIQPPISALPTIQIFANNPLVSTFLIGFNMYYNGLNNTNGKDYMFEINYQFNNGFSSKDGSPVANANISNPFYVSGSVATNVTPSGSSHTVYYYPPDNPPPYLEIKQEYSTIQYWNSFRSFVFTTGTIPVNTEFVPAINDSTGISSNKPILTDFQVSLNNPGDVRSQIQYFPQGPYRLIDLQSSQPLVSIDIKVFWQDQFGNLRPLAINTNQTVSIKLLFIHK